MWYDPLYDKLESLDEKILSGFQKVTEAAHKTLGWTKHDLSHLCVTGAAIAITGSGVYYFGIGYQDQGAYGYVSKAMGVIMAGFGYFLYNFSLKQKEKDEKKELEYIIKHDAAPPSKIEASRPVMAGFIAAMGGLFLYNLSAGTAVNPPEWRKINPGDYSTLINLFNLTMVGYFASLQARDYFRSTTMFPPKTERNLLQRLKNALPGRRVEAKVKV